MRPMYFEMLCAASVALGELGQSEQWARQAMNCATSTEMPHQRASTLAVAAHVHRARGKVSTAAQWYEQVTNLFSVIQVVRAQNWILISAAERPTRSVSVDHAAVLLALAEDLVQRCGAGRLVGDALDREHPSRSRCGGQPPPAQRPVGHADQPGARDRRYGRYGQEDAGGRRATLPEPRHGRCPHHGSTRSSNIKPRAALARLMTGAGPRPDSCGTVVDGRCMRNKLANKGDESG